MGYCIDTYEFVVGANAPQDEADAPGRQKLRPLRFVRGVDQIGKNERPIDSGALGIPIVDDVVDVPCYTVKVCPMSQGLGRVVTLEMI